MSHPTAHGPASDDDFPCDHALSVPFTRRRPLRRDLQDAHAGASARLTGIDAELEALLVRRRACLAELDQLRARLNRRWSHHHVRRHGRVDEPPMPPAPPGAGALQGTDLREVCLTLLRRHGPLSLRELHGLLHQYGYTVGGVRPVQRLGDAMAYEQRCGRTDRVSRGVYVACDGGPRRVDRCPSDRPGPGPLVPWAPPVTGTAPPLVDPDVMADPQHWSARWRPEGTAATPDGAGTADHLDDVVLGDDEAPDGEPRSKGSEPPPPPPTDRFVPLGDDSLTNRPRVAPAPRWSGHGDDHPDRTTGEEPPGDQVRGRRARAAEVPDGPSALPRRWRGWRASRSRRRRGRSGRRWPR